MSHLYIGLIARVPAAPEDDPENPKIISTLTEALTSYGAGYGDFTFSVVHVVNDDDTGSLRIIYEGYKFALETLDTKLDQRFRPGNSTPFGG